MTRTETSVWLSALGAGFVTILRVNAVSSDTDNNPKTATVIIAVTIRGSNVQKNSITKHGWSVALRPQGLLGTGAQDVYLDFHAAPELWDTKHDSITGFAFGLYCDLKIRSRQARTGIKREKKTVPVLRGGGDSSVVRAPDSWLKGRRFESLLERRENFLLQGRLSVLTLISVSVPPPCYRSST